MVLKGASMEVECVSHPLQVVDKIRELHPDIILMDVNMPFCNGIELSAIIRQYPELISIPIVFMTTDTNFEIRCLAEDFGAEEFLVKPVSTQQLITAVSSRAKRYRQLRDLSMELFENRSRHDNIVKTLNDVIWSAEPTAMNLTFISPSCSVVFGRSAESMKKDPDWRNFVFMEDRLFVQSEIDKLHAQENIDFVYRIVRSDYTFRWVSESIIKVTDAEGDITRYDGVIHDITSREMDKQNIKRRLTLESELSVFTKALLQNHDIDLAFECLLRMTSAKVIQVYHHHSIDDSQDTYTNLMRLGNTKYSGSTETIIHADKNAYWIKELKKGNHVFAPGLQPRFDVPYSNLLIPIFVQNVWFGFISFILDDSHPYGSGEELAIIKSATEILSNFFEKEKSSVEKARQDKLLLAAGKISRTLLLEHDFTKSIRSTLDIIRDSTGYDDIFILKFSAHDQQFSQYSECTLTVGKHIQQSYQSFLNQHWKTWSDQLYKKQSVVLSKSQIIDMDFDEDSEPAQNLISTPICPGLELWGVLVLISFRAEHHLQKQHLTVIKSIADSFGGALIRQKSHEDLLTATHLAEQANRSKSEFLANMSHEIRTPMNAIMGFAQLLKRDKGSAESTEYLDLILDSGTRLLSMITDVLDLANVDIGKTYVNKIQVDIQSLLTSIWEQYLPTIVQKGLRPSLEIGDEIPLAQTDPDKITRLVSNLLSNAVKFTDSGFITLKAGYQKTGESSFNLCIEVVDSGIGIPPSKQDIIFNAFEQADSSKTRRYSGIGLGLTLASRIIRILNGSIGFTSKHGVGTHFVVNLPIDFIRTSEKELSEPKQKTAVEQIHILAAEDNRINRLLISKIFEKTPYQLHLVENGQLAVEYLLEHPEIKLVLMDVHMPVLSGTEATVMIKANAKVAHVPVVALTASVLQEDIGICFEAGMDDFLEKPIQTDKLFSVLKKWCG
jgi:PAS domain S-box-containing protein